MWIKHILHRPNEAPLRHFQGLLLCRAITVVSKPAKRSSNLPTWSSVSSVPQGWGGVNISSLEFPTESFIWICLLTHFLVFFQSLSIRYPKPWIFQGTLILLWIYKAFLLIFLLLSLQVWKATSSLLRISELIALQHKYPTILILLHIALERLRLVLLECKFDPLLASKEQPIRNFFRHQVWFVKHPGGSTGPRGAVFFTSSSQ